MFKCTICKKEFEIKPDFCDCGNDEFTVTEQYIEKNTSAVDFVQNKPNGSSFLKKDKGEFISLVIFLLCIIFSVYFVFFFNGDEKNTKPAPSLDVQKKETPVSIPDIDEIWIQTKNTPDVKPISTIKPILAPKKEKVKTAASKKTINKPKEKIVPKVSSNVVKKPSPPSKIVKEAPKQPPSSELKNYKIALRNLIASKINFAAIAGDGKCTVAFQISNSGKLINRSFVVLSSNDTLNDNVYSALLNTPSFSPPPSSYNNEKLKLSISIYNGNFEVMLF